MTIAALEVAAACGAAPRIVSDIDVAAEHIADLASAWGPDGPEDGLAKQLARALAGTIPVIAGAGVTAPVAYRWKTQFNENAQIPAFANELPELDHNELVGWGGSNRLGRFSAVFLEDPGTHPRIAQRVALTQELIGGSATGGTHRVEAIGTTPFDRVFSLVLLGDLVSLYSAILLGVDPTPVTVLDELKAKLNAS
jgi:glucose/mannose-6-phosphate isomerase